MRFLLDENIPKRVASLIEADGGEVIDIRGSVREGCSDKELFALACEREAVLITTDRDFLHTIHFRQQPHPGIILITLRQPNAARIADRVSNALRYLQSRPITSCCLLLTDRHIRVYSPE